MKRAEPSPLPSVFKVPKSQPATDAVKPSLVMVHALGMCDPAPKSTSNGHWAGFEGKKWAPTVYVQLGLAPLTVKVT